MPILLLLPLRVRSILQIAAVRLTVSRRLLPTPVVHPIPAQALVRHHLAPPIRLLAPLPVLREQSSLAQALLHAALPIAATVVAVPVRLRPTLLPMAGPLVQVPIQVVREVVAQVYHRAAALSLPIKAAVLSLAALPVVRAASLEVLARVAASVVVVAPVAVPMVVAGGVLAKAVCRILLLF